MDIVGRSMVTITRERYDFYVAEIERLREQVEFERASLRSALEELKVSDKKIEWLQKELQGQALRGTE